MSTQIENLTLNKNEYLQHFVTSLLVAIRKEKISSVSLFSWNEESELLPIAATLGAIANDQLGTPCAALSINGLKKTKSSIAGCTIINLPEVDFHTYLKEHFKEFAHSFIAAPAISTFATATPEQTSLALSSEIKILILPAKGIRRADAKKIEAFTKNQDLKWYGILQVAMGGKS